MPNGPSNRFRNIGGVTVVNRLANLMPMQTHSQIFDPCLCLRRRKSVSLAQELCHFFPILGDKVLWQHIRLLNSSEGLMPNYNRLSRLSGYS